MKRLFAEHPISAVIHCAGLKAIGEGEAKPVAYYDNNVGGAITLAEAMAGAGVKTLVFSSSATVYGQPDRNPVTEDAPLRTASVYGRTKRMVEQLLEDVATSDAEWSIGLLRYFNPAGAHSSAQIGEAPSATPNNLVPMLAQVAATDAPEIAVFGNDWDTPDGTGVRDYVHVMDLAAGTRRRDAVFGARERGDDAQSRHRPGSFRAGGRRRIRAGMRKTDCAPRCAAAAGRCRDLLR